jgi:hypothetical protein
MSKLTLMKACFFISLFFICNIVTAQIVNIPDANFKNALVNENVAKLNGNTSLEDVDTNNDGEIQLTEAMAVTELQVLNFEIASLEGIQSFTNVVKLLCQSNNLTQIDVSQNTVLEEFWVSSNQITTLDVTANTLLEWLVCQENQLTSLDLSQNLNLRIVRTSFNEISVLDVSQILTLEHLWCSSNNLTSIDISANTVMTNFSTGNNQLTYLNLQNGNNANMTRMWAYNNPDLQCILVDDETATYPVCNQGSNTGWCKDEMTQYVEDLSNCILSIQSYNQSKLSIFPNPTNNVFTVFSEGPIKNIRLYSLQGRFLNSFTDAQIDIAHLNEGLYFIEVLFESGEKSIKKIIKR